MSSKALVGFVFPFVVLACSTHAQTFTDGGDDDAGVVDATLDITQPTFPDVLETGPTCVGLECQIPACGTTNISGTVYAPNGTLPLYNVIVYVPNASLDPFTAGVSCDQCGKVSGSPIVSALTDNQGHFELKNVPAGTNIPLVMQVGKWRRQVTIPTVTACVENPVGQQVSGVEQLTRLPKNQKEGSMPHIALTTGGCETFGCMLPKLGIDPAEFAPGPTSSSTQPKTAVSFYSGSGAPAPTGSPAAATLWNDVKMLKMFDLAMFSCECSEPSDANTTSYGAVRQYMEAGGRIFTTDFMYVWYKDSSDTNLNASPWSWPGGAPGGGNPVNVDTTFEKGKELSAWMYYLSSLPAYKPNFHTPVNKDVFDVTNSGGYVFDNVAAINPKFGLEWSHSGKTDQNGTPQHPRIITMNMPSAKPVAQQCGKGVHLDFHISQPNNPDIVDSTFPNGCQSPLREPELVTAFFFFDIASCIQDDTKPPVIPN